MCSVLLYLVYSSRHIFQIWWSHSAIGNFTVCAQVVHLPEDMSNDRSHFLPGQLKLLPPTLHLPPEHQPETLSAPPTCSEPAAETTTQSRVCHFCWLCVYVSFSCWLLDFLSIWWRRKQRRPQSLPELCVHLSDAVRSVWSAAEWSASVSVS